MNSMKVTRRDVLGLLATMGIGAAESTLAAAQKTKSDKLAGGKVVFENDKVRVISHLARPRMGVCGTGLHSHPPHLTIALKDVKAKVTNAGKEPFIAVNKAGDVFWDNGGAHVVENISGRDSELYLVELKG
ncbi:MAG: hypothetical protein IT521_02690 [Burkholderiales bacterium]|nr:hypothetical protein [Burkholderiales bacterium]